MSHKRGVGGFEDYVTKCDRGDGWFDYSVT